MEQIYYTQCPIGYGLGASNGFQVKRISAGYPPAGDFRHLGMRAFLPGSKILAPSALRYRRDGAIAEVAWLAPRAQEYETERGPWGRPGGHFAHGLRLEPGELAALACWPAGLFESPRWRRSDPEPSRGRAPDDLALGRADLAIAPEFAAVAGLAVGIGPERLAALLTAAAAAVREGRTLVLIAEADRLAPTIALLTFAFPEAYRPALTFSTYHDRPEELAGFRIQGTVPNPRLNRNALIAQGIVADLAAGTFEPPTAPAPWARTLAGWFARCGRDEEAAWNRTNELAAAMQAPEPAAAWSDDWLDHLLAFHAATRPPALRPADPAGWLRLAGQTAWAGRAGLARAWLVRGPSWWREIPEGSWSAESRAALVAHGALREAWHGSKALAAAWGATLAAWSADAAPAERSAAVAALLRAAPPVDRFPFLTALIQGLPPAMAGEVLLRLRADATIERAALLPLEAREAVARALDHGDPSAVAALMVEALGLPAALEPALDALAAEADARPGSAPRLAGPLADALEAADEPAVRAARAWALRRVDAEAWLAPHLRRLFAHPDHLDAWRRLRDQTPDDLRPLLAGAALEVAREPGLAPEAFCWAVEELLLPLDSARRPHDPAWPNHYLERTPPNLETAIRLFSKRSGNPALTAWIKGAHQRGELSAENGGRLRSWHRVARALGSSSLQELADAIPHVPPSDRGRWLALMIERVGAADTSRLDLCLDQCARAWPGAFAAGAPGLGELARPLAASIRDYLPDPRAWLIRLNRLLGRLGVFEVPGRGSEPDGLAAEIVAQALRSGDGRQGPWALRQALLRDDQGWRILAIDARLALRGAGPGEARTIFEHWDGKIDKGHQTDRFFELMLNCAGGPALAAIVAARAADLSTLGDLKWWAAATTPGAHDDIRDGLARLAPMAPLPEDSLLAIRKWMRRAGAVPVSDFDDVPGALGPTDQGKPATVPLVSDLPHLSPPGRARWYCLDALTVFHRDGPEAAMRRWSDIRNWRDKALPLPLKELDEDDRHRFLAWLILGLDEHDEPRLARLARWLVQSGLTDADRLKRWPDDLADPGRADEATRLARVPLVSDLQAAIRFFAREDRARRSAGA